MYYEIVGQVEVHTSMTLNNLEYPLYEDFERHVNGGGSPQAGLRLRGLWVFEYLRGQDFERHLQFQ